MDRDKRWERLEVAWKMLTRGEGKLVDDLADAVEACYEGGGPGGSPLTDEFITPLLAKGPDGKPRAFLRDGDACFFFNFRADRARQLTLALHAKNGPDEFPHFDRAPIPKLAAFSTMTRYDGKLDVPAAFAPQSFHMILGEVLSQQGVSQLRTAETEKYAHVTYFFNGGVEQPFPGEERRLVPSNRAVATYDLAPEMSAAGVTDGVVEALKPGGPTFILVNYANPDMVGHTGKLEPAVSAIETIDASMRRVVDAARAAGAAVFITADHGNCEMMIDPETGQPHTAHTTNPVPLLMIPPGRDGRTLAEGGRLADVAPTLLAYMGLPQPTEMDGRNLLRGDAPGERKGAAS
jgi:2,3-bisphosphoglycerate-independent phosphoglycerate mutase